MIKLKFRSIFPNLLPSLERSETKIHGNINDNQRPFKIFLVIFTKSIQKIDGIVIPIAFHSKSLKLDGERNFEGKFESEIKIVSILLIQHIWRN